MPRWMLLAVVLVGLLTAGGAFLWQAEPAVPAASILVVPDRRGDAGPMSPPPSPAPPSTAIAVAKPPPLAPAASQASVWDLCGVGPLAMERGALDLSSGSWAALPSHMGEAAQDSARERLLLLMTQGDARTRAAGLVLTQVYAQRFARSELESKAAAQALAETQQALLALARGSRDPALASWAVTSCRDDLECRARAAAVWREVEPDNAAPWLLELENMPESPGRVLSTIARSARYAVYPGTLAGAALEALPADLPPYLKKRLLLDVVQVEYVQARRPDLRIPFGPLPRLCLSTIDSMGQAVGLEASPQAAECSAIAELFSDRSDSLDGHVLGLRLGRAAGWPEAEVEARLEQAKLLQDARSISPGAQPYACAAVDQSLALVRDISSRGEMLALRAIVAEKAVQALRTSKP